MLRIFARNLSEYGLRPDDLLLLFRILDNREPSYSESDLKSYLARLQIFTVTLEMKTSSSMLAKYAPRPPTPDQYEILLDIVREELSQVNFLFMPPYRAFYYMRELPHIVTDAFPSASWEIREAQRCYAAGMFSACVHHCSRANEIGIRSLALALGVHFPLPLELAEAQELLNEIQRKIKNLAQEPKSAQRAEDIQYYSEAATQLTYFKDGWRNPSAHARKRYDEVEAGSLLNHTDSFFQVLAKRLKE